MLVRGLKRGVAVVGLLLLFAFVLLHFRDGLASSSSSNSNSSGAGTRERPPQPDANKLQHPQLPPKTSPLANNDVGTQEGGLGPSSLGGLHNGAGLDRDSPATEHIEVFSASTTDKRFFLIEFGQEQAINPNIVPHPARDDAWIIVAQKHRNPEEPLSPFAELACVASFINSQLRCLNPPIALPIPPTTGDASKCQGDLAYFSLNVGPHDARVFYGPDAPYTIYGSNSVFTCFGQWVLDFTTLMPKIYGSSPASIFAQPTELQRPAPYSPVEKNWFIFWDDHHHMYAHYDIAPKRVMAKLEDDGAVGPDIAPHAAANDDKCIEKYLPKVSPQLESLHQATNSLAVTLCSREEPSCEASDANTFILTIVQHKSFYDFHGEYEPYAVLFQQRAPFELHAISSKPIWIHGRGKGKPKTNSNSSPSGGDGSKPPHVPSEMFYITSISWKSRQQRYHGYSDDVLFIGFGIEDSKTAGIDVTAGDLLKDMGLCAQL